MLEGLLALVLVASPVAAEDCDKAPELMQDLHDEYPGVIQHPEMYECTYSLLRIYVSRGWNRVTCDGRHGLYRRWRGLWRRAIGDEHANIIVKDRHGRKVGDFKVFGGVEIRGCNRGTR